MVYDREADKHKVFGHRHLGLSFPIIPSCFNNIPVKSSQTCTLAHSSITAAERPSVTGYASQIEFAQWIVLLGCARCKELDKHKSTRGSRVFLCQHSRPGTFFLLLHVSFYAGNKLTCMAIISILWMCLDLSLWFSCRGWDLKTSIAEVLLPMFGRAMIEFIVYLRLHTAHVITKAN